MKVYPIYTILAIFLFSGCLKEEKIDTLVRVRIEMPEEFRDITLEGINVKLFNAASGLTYNAPCSADGIAEFYMEYGFYEGVVQHRQSDGNTIHIFNGRLGNIVVSAASDAADIYRISLTHAEQQKLIIKEIYYSGCKTGDNKNYNKDNYMSIYNNSDETAYLDSICIGFVQPMTSASKTNFLKEDGTLMDLLPVSMMAWQFPGTGKDYPLQPGEEVTIAINAIDHHERHPQSVDLSRVNFAFWNVNLSQQEPPAPGVVPMTQIWKGSGTGYTFVVSGPAFIMFRIEGNASEYASDQKNLMQDPVTHRGLWNLMIPKEWVIDGIECVMSAAKANKRLTDNVDAGFCYVPAQYQGMSVHRKVEGVVDGRTVYMDTNNSSEDIEVVRAKLWGN